MSGKLTEVSKIEADKVPEALHKQIDIDLGAINYAGFDEATLFELIKLILMSKKSDKLTIEVGKLINSIMGNPAPRNSDF